MRVFLDTNVIVSAFTTRGLCADLFRFVLAEHELIAAEVVLTELERVLLTRFGVSADTVAAILELLRNYPVIPKPEATPEIAVRDPDDTWVLASALIGKAEVLVTGDQDLLSLGNDIGLVIASPRKFWEMARLR